MRRIKIISVANGLIFASLLVFAHPAIAGNWEGEKDPLVVAKAVADQELFGKVITSDSERPAFHVHHTSYWEDAVLMIGVCDLYDREKELGSPVPRYLDYLEKWADWNNRGLGLPVIHGDQVAAAQVYIWLYNRTGDPKYLKFAKPMVRLVLKGRDIDQLGTHYHRYWMRFWNDDLFMVPPFMAMLDATSGSRGLLSGKSGREIAVDYDRTYADVLRDPATGLFWHGRMSKGKYNWSRGDGWAAAGFTRVMKSMENDPAFQNDVAWQREILTAMFKTLKDNRNEVGTWNSDILNRAEYRVPETSGTVFFVYAMANGINEGWLSPDYLPVVRQAWNFLKLSVTADARLVRAQPAGVSPIGRDFSHNSEPFATGGFLMAAVEMSKLANIH